MNDDEIKQSDAAAIIEFATKRTEPKVLTVEFEGEDEQVLITSKGDGTQIIQPIRGLFAQYAARPDRRMDTVTVHDVESFTALVNRDAGPEWSVIFADVPGRKLTAILDFHEAGGGEAGWGQDRIEYGFQVSTQLGAWLRAAGGTMDQKAFSRLIDDRLGDIGSAGGLDPDSIAADFAARRGIRFADVADLVVFTRTIASKSTVESREMVDENTGDVSIQYAKRGDVSTPDGKPVAVPQAFLLRIPVLCGLGATEFTIAVRLRFDIPEKSGIAWRIELHAMDKYMEAAIKGVVEKVRLAAPDGCGLPVFMGTAPV